MERRLAQQVDVLAQAAAKMTEATGRKHVIEDLFESRRGIQLALDEAMQAIVEERIDEKAARELLGELERAMNRVIRRSGDRKKEKLYRGFARRIADQKI